MHFIAHDPRPAPAKLTCPARAEWAKAAAPAKGHLAASYAALEQSGNRDHTLKELPALNHMFQTCVTGALDEYSRIDETVAPLALQTMGDWIAARMIKKP
jgi:hypothetical protein